MARLRHSFIKTWLLLCTFVFTLSVSKGVPGGQPQVAVELADSQRVRLSWPDSAVGFSLEGTSTLGPGALWLPVSGTPIREDSRFSVTIDATARQQFLRLRALVYPTIIETSPLDGETGVAVTRETIVRFSAPLSNTAVINGTNFYAGFGGRKLLSRVELSSDLLLEI